jgi:hypothetical protein
MVKVKVKFTLQQAMNAQRGRRGIALLFFDLDARWGLVVNVVTLSAHCTKRGVASEPILDVYGKSDPHRDLIPVPSSPWRVSALTELSRPPTEIPITFGK